MPQLEIRIDDHIFIKPLERELTDHEQRTRSITVEAEKGKMFRLVRITHPVEEVVDSSSIRVQIPNSVDAKVAGTFKKFLLSEKGDWKKIK